MELIMILVGLKVNSITNKHTTAIYKFKLLTKSNFNKEIKLFNIYLDNKKFRRMVWWSQKY
jgi:hypothetical protein